MAVPAPSHKSNKVESVPVNQIITTPVKLLNTCAAIDIHIVPDRQ